MMETNTAQSTPPTDGPSPLERPRGERVIAGVAAGLARRLDVPTWVIRLLFVVLAFAGGTGFFLYLIGWALIPGEGDEASAVAKLISRADGTTSWVGIALIGLAILIGINSIGFVRGDFAIALLLLVVGVLLYRGEIGGDMIRTRAEERSSGDVSGATDTIDGDSVDAGVESPPPFAGFDTPSDTTPPPPDVPTPPAPPRPPRRPKHPPSHLGRLTIGIGLVVIGSMALADHLMTTFDPTARHYLGAALAVTGLGLVVGGWFGRARGLIVVGILLIPALVVSPFTEFGFDGPIGERRFAPTTLADLDTPYELAIGELVIDLRDLDLNSGDARVDARVGIGSLVIIVPDDVEIDGEARVGIGEVSTPTATRAGFARIVDIDRAGTAGAVSIDARTSLGEVVVRQRSGAASGEIERTSIGQFGQTTVNVADPGALRTTYSYDNGALLLDLSAIDLTAIELARDLRITMGTGDVTVLVDDANLVDVNVEVGVGSIELFGSGVSGLGLERRYDGAASAVLVLDVEVGAGAVRVEEN